MYAITGITGQVGGIVAKQLLASGNSVRAVVRNENKGVVWAEKGCELAIADMRDTNALLKAFSGSEAVFILLPPTFDPSLNFEETREMVAALRSALLLANPQRIVCISTIGAQATQCNLLTQLQILENELSSLLIPITFLRPAWFMENFSWDLKSAIETQQIHSFLQPLNKPVPMVACADVGKIAAELLQEVWTGRRVIELEGPTRITPNEAAATFSRVLGKTIDTNVVDPISWFKLFTEQGMLNPMPRIKMLEGFNEGWIEFESGQARSIKGKVQLESVIRSLMKQ